MTRGTTTSATEPELIVMLKKLRYDLTDMQVKVSEALRMAGKLDHPDMVRFVCPDGGCRLELRSATKLAEHVYHSHDGPLPAHYAAIEAKAERGERDAA